MKTLQKYIFSVSVPPKIIIVQANDVAEAKRKACEIVEDDIVELMVADKRFGILSRCLLQAKLVMEST